jgi:hypothetical protein
MHFVTLSNQYSRKREHKKKTRPLKGHLTQSSEFRTLTQISGTNSFQNVWCLGNIFQKKTPVLNGPLTAQM